MSRIEWRMAYTVRAADGTLLSKGDRVEWFVSRWHRRRVPLPQLETADITARQMLARADGEHGLQPVKILYRGKLVVIERRYLTTHEPTPEGYDRSKHRVRFRQGELLD